MVACGEIVQQMFELAYRHVQQENGRHDIVGVQHTTTSRHKQIECGRQLEQRGETIGQEIIGIGEIAQISVYQSFDKQTNARGRAYCGNNRYQVMNTTVSAKPLVEKIEEREEEHQYAGEDADMEQHAQSVGWNMQISGFLVLGHHGHGVGVNHTFGYVTAFLREILRLAQADYSDEVGE